MVEHGIILFMNLILLFICMPFIIIGVLIATIFIVIFSAIYISGIFLLLIGEIALSIFGCRNGKIIISLRNRRE